MICGVQCVAALNIIDTIRRLFSLEHAMPSWLLFGMRMTHTIKTNHIFFPSKQMDSLVSIYLFAQHIPQILLENFWNEWNQDSVKPKWAWTQKFNFNYDSLSLTSDAPNDYDTQTECQYWTEEFASNPFDETDASIVFWQAAGKKQTYLKEVKYSALRSHSIAASFQGCQT